MEESRNPEGSSGEVKGGFSLELHIAYILLCAIMLILGLILGFNGRPEVTSYMIAGGIVAYLITSILIPVARWAPLMLTLGIHIGAIISYYSNPIVLPFVIVERWGERTIINIDVIQVILAYEIIASSLPRLRQNLKTQTPKSI